MATLKEKLQAIVDNLNTAVQDFSSLEITTVTGSVQYIITGTEFSFSQITQHVASGNLTLVAHHYIQFDQDATLFVKENLNDEQKALFTLHMETLKSSREARLAFLNFIKEVLGA